MITGAGRKPEKQAGSFLVLLLQRMTLFYNHQPEIFAILMIIPL